VAGDRTDLQWAIRALHLREAWSVSRGDGIVVATVDTGADSTIPDLSGRLLPGAHLDLTTGTIVAGSRPDQIGHGTHVAGIIAGKDDDHGITGTAPGAKILPINIATSDAPTSTQLAAALTYATTHGAKVINLSTGFPDVASDAVGIRRICAAVKNAVARKVVVVAAAGNDGLRTNQSLAPADCPGAISVAAIDSDLRPVSWSSYDGSVTVAAPGAAIWSTVPSGISPLGFSAESGTSMAAPFVAGLAALILSQHSD
jgi:subtilisin family serine protease